MTASLTPALALAYLHELSLDVRAAAVLDAEGGCLAGDPALAERARVVLAAGGGSTPVADGSLLLARTRDGGAIAVLAGDFAVVQLLSHDLEAAAAALEAARGDLPGSRDSPS